MKFIEIPNLKLELNAIFMSSPTPVHKILHKRWRTVGYRTPFGKWLVTASYDYPVRYLEVGKFGNDEGELDIAMAVHPDDSAFISHVVFD